MASVGEQLREAREKQGMTIAQVAERTKLRADHVRALEEGNYDVFAAPVYARGFVRSYASLLRLDVTAVLSALEAELGQSQRLQESTQFIKPATTFVDDLMLLLSKVKWGITLTVTGVALTLYIGVVSYRAWRTHKATDPLARLGPGLYQPARSNVGELLPLGPPAQR
ncbi:MAG: helix-turn-helix domain-containing protein [Verrucomicrobiota bacterium]